MRSQNECEFSFDLKSIFIRKAHSLQSKPPLFIEIVGREKYREEYLTEQEKKCPELVGNRSGIYTNSATATISWKNKVVSALSTFHHQKDNILSKCLESLFVARNWVHPHLTINEN